VIPERVLSVLVNTLVLALFFSACAEDWRGVYSNKYDVEDKTARLSRPFLFFVIGRLSITAKCAFSYLLVLVAM
jgi:hypothetical protein